MASAVVVPDAAATPSIEGLSRVDDRGVAVLVPVTNANANANANAIKTKTETKIMSRTAIRTGTRTWSSNQHSALSRALSLFVAMCLAFHTILLARVTATATANAVNFHRAPIPHKVGLFSRHWEIAQPLPLPHSRPTWYRWGNLGHQPDLEPTKQNKNKNKNKNNPIIVSLRQKLSGSALRLRKTAEAFLFEHVLHHLLHPRRFLEATISLARAWVFWYFSKDCIGSIYEDRWHAERDPDDFFGSGGMWISKGAHKRVVRSRIYRSKRNRQWVGLGYTPRLVWLVGVLLRGTFQCTSIPKVFNPKLTGWGAGTILGAKCTHQEWISVFMIGWFGSEYYWKILFGCDGPPYPNPGGGFDGVPISITKVRLF